MENCRIYGVSSKALIVYANEDFSKWLYLCKQCHDRLIAKTGGVIPLSLFRSGEDEERGNNRLLAKGRMDLILVVKRKADFIRMKNSSSFNVKQNSLSSRSATMPILTANRDNNICPLLGHFP